MNKVVLSKVIETFGINSFEDVVASLAKGDGDMWSRMYSHGLTKTALSNIVDRLCLLND
jgi:hypothetical protein